MDHAFLQRPCDWVAECSCYELNANEWTMRSATARWLNCRVLKLRAIYGHIQKRAPNPVARPRSHAWTNHSWYIFLTTTNMTQSLSVSICLNDLGKIDSKLYVWKTDSLWHSLCRRSGCVSEAIGINRESLLMRECTSSAWFMWAETSVLQDSCGQRHSCSGTSMFISRCPKHCQGPVPRMTVCLSQALALILQRITRQPYWPYFFIRRLRCVRTMMPSSCMIHVGRDTRAVEQAYFFQCVGPYILISYLLSFPVCPFFLH